VSRFQILAHFAFRALRRFPPRSRPHDDDWAFLILSRCNERLDNFVNIRTIVYKHLRMANIHSLHLANRQTDPVNFRVQKTWPFIGPFAPLLWTCPRIEFGRAKTVLKKQRDEKATRKGPARTDEHSVCSWETAQVVVQRKAAWIKSCLWYESRREQLYVCSWDSMEQSKQRQECCWDS
jgi:hypothetical protein